MYINLSWYLISNRHLSYDVNSYVPILQTFPGHKIPLLFTISIVHLQ